MKKRYTWVLTYVLTIGCVLATVHWGNQAVTVIAENMPAERKHCVVIDAGHGGEDGGATSCTGRLESDYNLEIALRLEDLLHLMGYSVRMTRSTEDALSTSGNTIAQRKLSDLKNRTELVNTALDPVLISIHQNQFPEPRYYGAQVFYAGTNGSRILAEKLQSELITCLNPGSKRQAKRINNVYLMEHIYCPAVLLECGFISNPQEEMLLSDSGYQKRLCCVVSAAVHGFLKTLDPPTAG